MIVYWWLDHKDSNTYQVQLLKSYAMPDNADIPYEHASFGAHDVDSWGISTPDIVEYLIKAIGNSTATLSRVVLADTENWYEWALVTLGASALPPSGSAINTAIEQVGVHNYIHDCLRQARQQLTATGAYVTSKFNPILDDEPND